MLVAADEEDREQVEQAARVALEAVMRAAVLARAVVDRQLGNPPASLHADHGDESVELAVEVEALPELPHQRGDLRRIVLPVAVQRDDDPPARLLEAGLQRGRLAEVAAQLHEAERELAGEPLEQ